MKDKIKKLKEQDQRNVERGMRNIASRPSQTQGDFDRAIRRFRKKVGK